VGVTKQIIIRENEIRVERIIQWYRGEGHTRAGEWSEECAHQHTPTHTHTNTRIVIFGHHGGMAHTAFPDKGREWSDGIRSTGHAPESVAVAMAHLNEENRVRLCVRWRWGDVCVYVSVCEWCVCVWEATRGVFLAPRAFPQ
jgi:hypothetical protein